MRFWKPPARSRLRLNRAAPLTQGGVALHLEFFPRPVNGSQTAFVVCVSVRAEKVWKRGARGGSTVRPCRDAVLETPADAISTEIHRWLLRHQSLGMSVHIHAVALEKPDEREMKTLRQIHRQRRGCPDSGDKRDSRDDGLLNNLIADAARNQQHVIEKRKSSRG